ncbi:MAG: excinuclease ABC subunit UvrC [Spirochaetes bacterium]|jgi:excinuclease ABC subunit C|nr:excinuclease ABC subunit UvrC [Spirochaetota bacterium]
MKQPDKIKLLISNIPTDPGIYMMKDGPGTIIYIGKASSLKKRVSSYFRKTGLDPKTAVLVKHISDIEYIVTDSEIEALILESNLIKKHKPKYNIRLKDDKRYPYIAVTLEDDYPGVVYTRKTGVGKNRYFGPYTDARAAKNTVEMINSVFKLKRCGRPLPLKNGHRPCLNYQMKRCSGVCLGKITKEEYRSIIDSAIEFLEGNIGPVIDGLSDKMKTFSGRMEFEKAAQIRDMIEDIRKISEYQKVSVPFIINQDFIGISVREDEAIIIIFEFRNGLLLGRKITVYENASHSSPGEILSMFILDHYGKTDIPQKIITGIDVRDGNIIEDFLSKHSMKKITVKGASSKDEQGIIKMIVKNIDVISAERSAGKFYRNSEKGMLELKEILGLERPPSVIECFDISNLNGKNAVASMACFREGSPDKSSYRRYRIRGYDSANDPGMIHEVISRRIQYLTNEGIEMPDLFVIDGGITQLARAREAAENFYPGARIISIAKRFEEIYYSPREKPLLLPANSNALRILQRVRDEAHRFAVSYHRKIRDKNLTASILDDIRIGKNLKNRLLSQYKSIEGIRNASIDDIKAIKGIGSRTAAKIYNFFHRNMDLDDK